MKTHEQIISKLKEYQSPTPSKWRDNAEAEQSMATPFTAHCYDDVRQDGGTAYVPEATFGTHGLQSAVCLEGTERAGESFP